MVEKRIKSLKLYQGLMETLKRDMIHEDGSQDELKQDRKEEENESRGYFGRKAMNVSKDNAFCELGR